MVVIGAGQAGLSLSYYLTRQSVHHVVLEKGHVADTWRNRRWDSFTLVTPNWRVRLPDFPYRGDNPDGFMPRDDVVSFIEAFARSFKAPVRTGVCVRSLECQDDHVYLIRTDEGTIEAGTVVVATGAFQAPKIPPFSSSLPRDLLQIPSEQYRNPRSLPDGAILIVGSGQSGTQIAEELVESGRTVYLATSGAGRLPRRYRGKDILHWFAETGMDDDRVDDPVHQRAKFEAAPHLTGKNGGHDITLRGLEAQGVVLLGSLLSTEGDRLRFLPNLKQNFAKEEQFARQILARIDRYLKTRPEIAPAGTDHSTPSAHRGRRLNPVLELDVRSAGISTVIWATGYRPSFDWIHIPVFDEDGYPVQERGVTAYPGLYFLGLHWMHTRSSGLIFGVGRDAEYLASRIVSDRRLRPV